MRVNDEHTIRKYMPLDEIPGLVIDGHLVCENSVPERELLADWLKKTGISR